jgi:dynein heavy chain
VIKTVGYDIIDLDMKQFDDTFYEFRATMKELERRLGSVITQGFEDCSTIAGRFKLFDSFDSLVKRPIIADELEKKHMELIASYADDLHTVQHLFMENRNTPPIAHNLPPIAGALTWCRGLLERVRLPMDKLRLLERKVMEREEAREVIKDYTTFLGQLADFEQPDRGVGRFDRVVVAGQAQEPAAAPRGAPRHARRARALVCQL